MKSQPRNHTGHLLYSDDNVDMLAFRYAPILATLLAPRSEDIFAEPPVGQRADRAAPLARTAGLRRL